MQYININSIIPYYDRFDYISNLNQELLFILTIEYLINLNINIYISTLRTLFIEIYRIMNHLLNIGTYAIDIGLFTSML